MEQLTDRQVLHRQYLKSPIWKEKRKEALEYYGCICARCEQFGTDVHHKTYERTGGQELLNDLEVLCRGCHEAHHCSEHRSRKRERNEIGRKVIFRYLTDSQRIDLAARFKILQVELARRILCDDFFTYLAAGVLGFKHVCEGFKMPRHRLISTQSLIQGRGKGQPKGRKQVMGKIRSCSRSGC